MIFLPEESPGMEEFGQLIVAHMGLIRKVAARQSKRLPKSIEIDDMVSVAVMGLYRSAGKFDPTRGTFEAWMPLVARTAIIDAFRRRNYEYELHAGLDEHDRAKHSGEIDKSNKFGESHRTTFQAVSKDPSPEDVLDRKRRCAHVRRALQTLHASERKAVEDRVMGDKTYCETGRAQGRSASWAFYKTHCGLHKLKRSLAMHRLEDE